MPLSKLNNSIGRIVLIAVFAVVAMIPIYWNGVPVGNDQRQHFQFATTVYDSVSAGDLYPSFAAETNHGFGDYGIRFYPPLTYYAFSAAYFVVQDWYIASLLAFTLVFFIGGLGIYFWAREEFEPPQALITVIFYTFAPYHLNQLYNNALFAEFFATAIIPFCFLFLARVCRNGKWINVLGLTVAYSLLILTHLPMTIICSLAMALYGLLLLRRSNFISAVGKLITAVFAAVLMTSFYWSRWLPELDWITHSSPKYFSTTWDYRTNFLLLPDHFLKFGEDALNLWFADVMLAATILVTIPTGIYLFRVKTERTKFVVASAAVLVVAVIMTTLLSSVIWNNAGFLQKVQFPWRWMTVVSAFGAIVASVGIYRASDMLKSGDNIPATIGLGFVLSAFFFTATFVTRGAAYNSHEAFNHQLENIASSEGCDCWWPIWAKTSAFGQIEKVVAQGRDIDVGVWSSTVKNFRVEPGEPATTTVAAFYYPRWQATVNGSSVPVTPSENGMISLPITAEAADIHVEFKEPYYVKPSSIASAAVWLFVLVLAAVLLVRSRKSG